MKNRVTTLALLAGLFFCQSLFGSPLDNWLWRNPFPNGNPQTVPHTMKGVVFANGQFVAVGAGGVVSLSSDSTNWVESATATTNNLNSVAYLNGRFVAVGDNGALETSTDGLGWTLQVSGTTNSLVAVAFANGNYVAVGASAVITSSDAITWSPAVSGLSGATGVVGGDAGFVAVGGTGSVFFGTSNLVFSSSSGSLWTSQVLTVPSTGNPFIDPPLQNRIVTYANGAYLVGSYRYFSSQSVDKFIFRSIDGNSWTTNKLENIFVSSQGFSYNFFMSGNGLVIAAGNAGALPFLQFSADGINWSTTNNLPTSYNQGSGDGRRLWQWTLRDRGSGKHFLSPSANFHFHRWLNLDRPTASTHTAGWSR